MRPEQNSLRLLPSGSDRVGETPVRPASRSHYIRSLGARNNGRTLRTRRMPAFAPRLGDVTIWPP